MASTATDSGKPPYEAAFEHVKDLNENFLAGARQAGNLYLDSYEKAVDRAVQLEVKLARLTEQEWIRNVIEAQADIARELSASYVTAARSVLK